ncbi:MAG: substrate-binding domain-containing protein [Rhodospirillales bacterium]|nr:substrate-binding domain-containing protein [Rhodospirillales bacterium]
MFKITALALSLLAMPAAAADLFITLASTTSTENSGLFAYMLPRFKAQTGISVRVVAVGTGAALRLGQRGDADALLVHARNAEMKFVAAGYGVERRDVMFNDFVLIGPSSDPAGLRGGHDIVAALRKIASTRTIFISRGDDSGTNKAERRHWKSAGIDPTPNSGKWYLETGAGMGATLNITAAKSGYTLTDRATWLAFGNRGGLAIAVEGDPKLRNPYGVIMVNPAKHPHVKRKLAMAFINWITSPKGRETIASFRLQGKQVFFPAP